MKRIFTIASAIMLTGAAHAQTVTDTVVTGPSYANQVWYSLPNDEQGTAPKDNWDIAFEISGYTSSILANTQKGLEVFQTPYAAAAWATTLDTANMYTNWQALHNSDVAWQEGALNSHPDGNTDLGWGDYDMNSHAVTGDSIYLVKLMNGEYKKLKINSLTSGTYSFTWANIDGTSEQTATIAKSAYTGKNFAYFSLENNTALDNEPINTAWDFTFTKYITVLMAPNPTPYGVTGILLNKNATAIKAATVDVATVDYNDYIFQSEINTIGYNWKTFNSNTFQYVIEDSLAYFVERANGDVWKVIFTGFSGGTAGRYTFTKELVYTAPTVGIAENTIGAFTMYPNPARNQFNMVYTYEGAANSTVLNIHDLSGREVMNTNIDVVSGLNQQRVDVSALSPDIYVVSLPAFNKVQKLIIE